MVAYYVYGYWRCGDAAFYDLALSSRVVAAASDWVCGWAGLSVNNVIFAIFLAWAIKSIVLRIGGIRAYRAGRPFFIGLIMGHFVGAGISFVVDMIWFPGQGHSIPFSD